MKVLPLNLLLLALSVSTGIADTTSTTNKKTHNFNDRFGGKVFPRELTYDNTMRQRQRHNEIKTDDGDSGYSDKGKSGPNDDTRKQGKKGGHDHGGNSRKGRGKGVSGYDSHKKGKKGQINGGNSGKGRGKKGDDQAGGVITISPTLAPITLAPGASPTPTPSLTPEQIACNFLSVASLTECRAKLSFNPIIGDSTNGTTIPTEIGLLTQLTFLSFFLTHLTGSIPASLAGLTQLTELRLDYNQFTRGIPPSLSTLTLLTTLTLDGTGLTGSIPSSLASLTQLTWLTFNNNELTGTIPPSFSNLTELRRLEFSANILTGSIPSSLSNLTNLVTFHVDNNTLTGSIPQSFCSFLSFPVIDCGEIECNCCADSENFLCP